MRKEKGKLSPPLFFSEALRLSFGLNLISNDGNNSKELLICSRHFQLKRPDDRTRAGILAAGASETVYGTPVLPGAMFLVGTIGHVPILGVPACGMYHKITVLDLLLPRILTGEAIGRKELAGMGHGGLCRNSPTCLYPVCSFGK